MSHSGIGRPCCWRLVRVRRYRYAHCRRTYRQDMTRSAMPPAKISRLGLGWALRSIVIDHRTVTRVAAGPDVSCSAANTAVLAEGRRRLIDNPTRFNEVTTIAVDEYVWRRTRHGDKYVTLVTDLTPARNTTGAARLLDMVEAVRKRSSSSSSQHGRPGGARISRSSRWTGSQASRLLLPKSFPTPPRHGSLPYRPPRRRRAGPVPTTRSAGPVRPPWDEERPSRQGPPHPPHGADPLTERQRVRLKAVFDSEEHVEVYASWGICQRMCRQRLNDDPVASIRGQNSADVNSMVNAYREPDKK